MRTRVRLLTLVACVCVVAALPLCGTAGPATGPAASGAGGASLQSPPESSPALTPEQVAERKAQAYYHFSLGHLYQDLAGFTPRTDYLQRAIEEFKQAIAYDPDSSYLVVALAEAYQRGGRIRDAVLEAQTVLKSDPDNLPAHRLLARIYLQTLGEFEPQQSSKPTLQRAIDHYEAIARLAADDTDASLMLARLYRLNNQPEKAEATLKRLLATQPHSEQAIATLAQLYSDKGDYAKAIDLLKELTAQEPSSQLLATLAEAYERAGDTGNAVAAYRRAIEREASNTDLRHRLAQTLISAGRYADAITEYQVIARLNPEDLQAHIRLSQLHRHRGEFREAEAALVKAGELAADNPEVGLSRALLSEAEGKFAEATQALSDLVATTTRAGGRYTEQERHTRAILLEQLGQLHRRREQFDTAVQTFDLMMELGEESTLRAYSQIIETLRQARRLDAALQRAQEAVERFADMTSLRLQLATLHGDRGELEQGVEMARSLLGGQPADREVHLSLAQIYERNKRYPEAEQALAEAEKLSNGRDDLEFVYFLRGAINERQKKYEQAEREFRKALELNPTSALTLNYLGYMLADRGVKLEESVELVKRALALDPYNGAYLDSLGWAYFRQGKYELAEDYLRRAVERVSRDPVIHEHLGDLYEKLGRLELAEKHWERSLEEWQRMPKTEFDPEVHAKTEAKLRAVKTRLANQRKR